MATYVPFGGAQLSSEDAPPEAPTQSLGRDFSQGLRSGMISARGNLNELAGTAMDAVGLDGGARRAASVADQAAASEAGQGLVQLGDVDDLSSGLRWAAGGIGRSAPQSAVAVGAGLLTRGKSFGAGVGAGTAALAPFEVGEQVQRQRADPANAGLSAGEHLGAAALPGVGAAALQSIIPATVAGSLAGRGASRSLGSILGHAALDAPAEGLAEAGAEGIRQFGLNQVNPNAGYDLEAIKHAGYEGAALGGALGGVGAVGDVAHKYAGAVVRAPGQAIDAAKALVPEKVKEAPGEAVAAAGEAVKGFPDQLAGLYQAAKDKGTDLLDKMAEGREVADPAAPDQAGAQAAADQTTFQRATQWATELANEHLGPEKTAELRQAMADLGDKANQMKVAALKRGQDAVASAKESIDAFHDAVAARASAKEDAGDVKKSEDFSGVRAKIGQAVMGVLGEDHPALSDPASLAKLADGLRPYIEQVASGKAFDSMDKLDHLTKLIDVLGDKTTETLQAVHDAVDGASADKAAFFNRLNQIEQVQQGRMTLLEAMQKNLRPELQGAVRSSELAKEAEVLDKWARSKSTRLSGADEMSFTDAKVKAALQHRYGDKADVVLAAVEKNMKHEENILELAEMTERKTADGISSVRYYAQNKQLYLRPEMDKGRNGFEGAAAQRMKTAQRDNPGATVAFKKASEIGLDDPMVKAKHADLVDEAKTHGLDDDQAKAYADKKIDDFGAVSAEASKQETQLNSGELDAMRLDTKAFGKSAARIDAGTDAGGKPVIIDSIKLIKTMKSKLEGVYTKADDTSTLARTTSLFKEGIAAVQAHLGKAFEVPDTTQITPGKNGVTWGEAQRIVRDTARTAEDKANDSRTQEINRLRAEFRAADSIKERAAIAKEGKKLVGEQQWDVIKEQAAEAPNVATDDHEADPFGNVHAALKGGDDPKAIIRTNSGGEPRADTVMGRRKPVGGGPGDQPVQPLKVKPSDINVPGPVNTHADLRTMKKLEDAASARQKAQEGPPSPKVLAAKQAAFTEKARSGDPALLKSLAESDDAKGLQRAVEHIAGMKGDGFAKTAETINARLSELVQEPGVAYGLQTKRYSLMGVGRPTTNFERWFGDSKIVDANGKPRVVYHGTGADVTEIISAGERNQRAGALARADGQTFGNRGIYFSKDPAYASAYAGSRANKGGGVMYPVYLSIKNPKIIPKLDHSGKASNFWQRLVDKVKPEAQDARVAASRELRQSSMYVTVEDKAALMAQGYDGIINEDANEIIAFEPTQIKSAIGNDGSFDPKNPDIRYSLMGLDAREVPFEEFLANNGSGESAASQEAVNRREQEQARGQARIRVDKYGNATPLFLGVDARAAAGDVILQRGIGRDEWTVLDQGANVDRAAAARAMQAAGKFDLTRAAYSQERADPTAMGPQDRKSTEAYFEKVLGPQVIVKWAGILHAGDFTPDAKGVRDIIQLSVHALNPMSVAYHESLHGFFANLKRDGLTDISDVLEKAGASAPVLNQLKKLLANEPAALRQLTDPEERAAYMYQFHAQGKLNLGPNATSVFERIAKFIRQVTGLWTNDERAEQILAYFHSGDYQANRGDPNAVRQALMESTTSRALAKLKGATEPFREMGEALASAGGARLRDTGIPALRQLADTMKLKTTTEGKDAGYIPAARAERSQRMNQLSAKLKPYSAEVLAEALEAMQNGVPAASLAARDAAKIVDRHLQDMLTYMQDAGVRVKELGLKDGVPYFPRSYDASYISSHQRQFVAMLERNGVDNPRATMQKIMVTDGAEFTVEVDKPGMQHAKLRKLAFIPHAELAPFMRKDLYQIMNNYTTQATRRAEWARRLGDDGSGVTLLLDRAKAEGATQPQLDTAMKFVRAVDGTLSDDRITPTARRLMGNMIVYQNIRLLPLAIFSSVVDPQGVLVRGGTVGDTFATFKRGIREITKNFQKEPGTDAATELAEAIGTIDSAMLTHTLGASYSQGMVGDMGRKINDGFFRYNLMEQWNNSMRVGATEAALGFLVKHATRPGEHSTRYLRELGLEAADVQVGADGRPKLFEHEGLTLEHAAKMRAAVNRWVDGAVLRPDAVDKPVWMSDPRFALVAHLKQFVFSFHETILKRVAHEAKHGNFSPAMALASYVPVMIAADAAKGLIQGGGDEPAWKKGWTAGDYVWSGLERAGMFGVGQFAIDGVTDIQRGGSGVGALLGPSVEQLTDSVRVLGGHAQFGSFALKSLPANALYAAALKGESTDPKFVD